MGVHICSSPQDHAMIWQLAEDLRRLGCPLVDKTRTGDITVLAVSDETLNSRECFDQLQRARTHGSGVVFVQVRPLTSNTSWSPPVDMIDYTHRTQDTLIALSYALANSTTHSRRWRTRILLGIAAVTVVISVGVAAFLLPDRDSPGTETAQQFVDSVNREDFKTLSTVLCAADQKGVDSIFYYLSPNTGDRVELRSVDNESFTIKSVHGEDRIPIVNENGHFVACGYRTSLDTNGFVVKGWST